MSKLCIVVRVEFGQVNITFDSEAFCCSSSYVAAKTLTTSSLHTRPTRGLHFLQEMDTQILPSARIQTYWRMGARSVLLI